MSLEKNIGGVVRRWRIPHEHDMNMINERENLLELYPNSPLADCWKKDVEYLKWINCID